MYNSEVINKESLATAFTNMKSLKVYSVDFPSKEIVDILDSNGVGLDHFGFYVLGMDDPIGESFQPIQTALSVSTVSSLEITCGQLDDVSAVSKSVTDLCLSLQYLTNLEIMCKFLLVKNVPILVVDIIQNLKNLKNLAISYVVLKKKQQLMIY